MRDSCTIAEELAAAAKAHDWDQVKRLADELDRDWPLPGDVPVPAESGTSNVVQLFPRKGRDV